VHGAKRAGLLAPRTWCQDTAVSISVDCKVMVAMARPDENGVLFRIRRCFVFAAGALFSLCGRCARASDNWDGSLSE
jgi:hypothetical protein